ncbi:MAG: ASKHA domain-containing protein, partial [Dehalococcoidales bacterium]
ITEEPYNQDEMLLIIDIGTNGELILGNRKKLMSSSCATGPAFEGAEIRHGMRAAAGAIEKLKIDSKTKEVQFKVIGNDKWNTEDKKIGARGICGSGIFDAAAQMFIMGIIDKSGRINMKVKSNRLRFDDNGIAEFVIAWAKETAIDHDIVICQKDIRAIQLAKGAMYSGAKIMMNKMGVSKIDRVILAGAFGSYIDKTSAAAIGLFPDCDQKFVYAVGNAAGDGARIALLNKDKRDEADYWARRVEYIELTLEPEFNKIFTKALNFPHAEDKFPHLKDILPA